MEYGSRKKLLRTPPNLSLGDRTQNNLLGIKQYQ